MYQPILSAYNNDSQPAKMAGAARRLPKWQALANLMPKDFLKKKKRVADTLFRPELPKGLF